MIKNLQLRELQSVVIVVVQKLQFLPLEYTAEFVEVLDYLKKCQSTIPIYKSRLDCVPRL